VRQDRLRWALVALGSAVIFVALGWLAGRTSVGAWVDSALREAVLRGLPEVVRRGLDHVARPLVIVVLAPVSLLLALLALVRRRWRQVAAACCIAVVPVVLALALPVQDALALADDAYPSDHATAAFALVVAVAVLWPAPLGRRGIVLAGVVALSSGIGNVSWYAHEVSDVVGSALLVTAVAGAALALTGSAALNLRRPMTRGSLRPDPPEDLASHRR